MYRLNLPRQFLPKPPASSVPILHLPRSDATFGSKILLVLVRIQVLTLSRNTFNLSNSQVKSAISFKQKEEKEGESIHNFQLARAKLGISWVAFCLERDFWIWVWISKISKLIDNAPWNPTFSAASTRATISVKKISINTFLLSSAYFLPKKVSKIIKTCKLKMQIRSKHQFQIIDAAV